MEEGNLREIDRGKPTDDSHGSLVGSKSQLSTAHRVLGQLDVANMHPCRLYGRLYECNNYRTEVGRDALLILYMQASPLATWKSPLERSPPHR